MQNLLANEGKNNPIQDLLTFPLNWCNMFVTYILISVVLVVLGFAASVYFVRFLKNANVQNITIPALSESFNTFVIGIFYLYCAIVMAQQVITSTPMPMDNENDITIIEENEDPTTNNPSTEMVEETTIATTTLSVASSSYPNQEFLVNYQSFLQNALRQRAHIKKHKELEKSQEIKKNEKEMNGTNLYEEDCFEKMFMENSMFLYSFLHSAISLIISTTKANTLEVKMRKSEKSQDSNMSNEEIPTQNSVKKDTCHKENHSMEQVKLSVKILVIFLIPIVCIITLYYVLEQNMQINSNGSLMDANRIASNNWSFIYEPLNVSTSEDSPEVNRIIKNVYTIINSTRHTTPPTIYYLNTRRRPKQITSCPKFNMIYRFYALLVFVFYFVTTLYTKVKEIEMRASDAKFARQLHISIIIFAVLWLFSVLDMFSKTYLLDSGTSNILTDIFLTLGNLNHLSIIGTNYLIAKETIKKYNLVEPQA